MVTAHLGKWRGWRGGGEMLHAFHQMSNQLVTTVFQTQKITTRPPVPRGARDNGGDVGEDPGTGRQKEKMDQYCCMFYTAHMPFSLDLHAHREDSRLVLHIRGRSLCTSQTLRSLPCDDVTRVSSAMCTAPQQLLT